jgi:hypothetical protein
MAVKAMKPKTAVAAVEEENREQTNTAQEYWFLFFKRPNNISIYLYFFLTILW